MREFKTAQGIIRNVAIDKLFVDPAYQRDPNPHQARRIASEFDFEFYGMPVVSHRGGGRYALLDGQQRTEGLKRLYPDGVDKNGNPIMVGVLVVSRRKEHEIYVRMNQAGTRQPVNANLIFKANLGGGEKIENTIRRVLLDNGIEIRFGKGAAEVGMTKAAAAFKAVYEAVGGAARFREVVEMLVEVYSRPDGHAVESAALASDFLKGLAKYLKTTGYTISRISDALKASGVESSAIVQVARLRNLNNRYRMLDGIRDELDRLVEANLSKTNRRSRRRAA